MYMHVKVSRLTCVMTFLRTPTPKEDKKRDI